MCLTHEVEMKMYVVKLPNFTFLHLRLHQCSLDLPTIVLGDIQKIKNRTHVTIACRGRPRL